MSLDDTPQGLPPAPGNIPNRLDSEPDDAPRTTRETVTIADVEQMLVHLAKQCPSRIIGYVNYSWHPQLQRKAGKP